MLPLDQITQAERGPEHTRRATSPVKLPAWGAAFILLACSLFVWHYVSPRNEGEWDQESYELGAFEGNGRAMRSLGLMCQNRQQPDYACARSWYEEGASRGDDGAMNNLGYLYWRGLGVRQNLPQARYWFERAAMAGNEQAEGNLRQMEEERHREIYESQPAQSRE
jgi:hypothetical protein